MNILLVAAEVFPFAKTGGLGDFAGSLPKVLVKLGHDVRVVMPRYRCVERTGLTAVGGPLGVPMGTIGDLWCAVLEGRLPNSDVPVYFIDCEQYFDRDGLYNGADAVGFIDNDNRFVFLSRAALQLSKMIGFRPDVVHCNDWHTAAIPVLLNTLYRNDPILGSAASILTIHNIEYQGEYFPGLMDVLDVGWEHFNHLELECDDEVNLLKGGIYHSTLWNTVSPKYAEEIQTPKFGHGLEGVAMDRRGELRGILNGIDYDEWSPESDQNLAAQYSSRDLSGKAICKSSLQAEMGLPVRDDVPLFGIISRLVHQKGVDLLAKALPSILRLDLQFVLLGTGEPWAHDLFPKFARVFPEKFACTIDFDNALAHRIEAGCDLYVMPSRFEPCGLNQLYSLRYGTLPVVHAVGGLDDTVENYDEAAGSGTGFKFYDLNPKSIFDTIGWAVSTWYNRKPDFLRMVRRAMNGRFSWEGSAKQYVEMYREAVDTKTESISNR